MLFPLLIAAQESQLNNDFQLDNHLKRKKFVCGISSEIYKTNKLSYSDDIKECCQLVYPDFDNWMWSEKLKKIAKDIWKLDN